MDETTVKRTKSAINLMLDVFQTWIDTVPEYDITQKDIAKLQKKLKKAQENIEKIQKTVEEKAKTVD
ncbi:MAG: hypothetical protein P1P80_10005 [ANME-2 cluster archaeon]|nr:hypothetical protein [ANME-2 cluster archaeon]